MEEKIARDWPYSYLSRASLVVREALLLLLAIRLAHLLKKRVLSTSSFLTPSPEQAQIVVERRETLAFT